MSRQSKKPSVPARIAAWAATVLLAIALTGTVISQTSVRILTSEDLHINSAVNDEAVNGQMERLSGTIRELSAKYSFHAEEVIEALDRKEFINANREMAVWWTKMATTGVMDDEIPEWSSDSLLPVIEKSLIPEMIPEDQDSAEVAQEIGYSLEKAAKRMIMPVRRALVTIGMRYLNKKTDMPGIIRLITETPKTGIAVCFLLSGLIAFLTARKIRTSLKHYGAAFGGAGLITVFCMILIRQLGITDMIRESSEGFANQVSMMARSAETEIIIITAVLFLISATCLTVFNHRTGEPENHGGGHETKTSRTPDSV